MFVPFAFIGIYSKNYFIYVRICKKKTVYRPKLKNIFSNVNLIYYNSPFKLKENSSRLK